MIDFIIFVLLFFVFAISAYGWGKIPIKIFYRTNPQSSAYTITVGLSVLILIGGVLNFLRLALPMTLEILLLLGVANSCVYAALAIRRNVPRFLQFNFLHLLQNPSRYLARLDRNLIPILLLSVVTGFFMITLIPVSAFNYADDFQKYIVAPFQMLQSGTLGGTPFQVVGRDHLGSQPYLQSFLLTRFPATYINWFDIGFCFFVAGVLINDIGRKANVHPLLRSFAIILFVFINPQYVNVSALYSGSMFILGLLYAAILFVDAYGNSESNDLYLAAVPFGLIVASLISLKATFLAFCLLFSALVFLAFLVLADNKRQTTIAGGVAIVTASIALVPWVLISYNNYGRIIADAIATREFENRGSLDNPEWLSEQFFTIKRLAYRGTNLDYNFAIFTLTVAVIISLYLLFLNRQKINGMYIAVGLCAFISAMGIYLFNGHITHNLQLAVRFTAPVFIAIVPASVTILLGKRFWLPRARIVDGSAPTLRMTTVFFALQIIIVGLFAKAFIDRVVVAKNHRLALSYFLPDPQKFIEYNRFSMKQKTRARVREIQSMTTAGIPIFTWVSMPFHFDFERNPILNMEAAELVMEYPEDSLEGNSERLRNVLRSFGVRYVIWQPTAYGMESERNLRKDTQVRALRHRAISKLKLKVLLRTLEKKSKVLFKSGDWTLYDIDIDQ